MITFLVATTIFYGVHNFYTIYTNAWILKVIILSIQMKD
jgi:hypothetical protein